MNSRVLKRLSELGGGERIWEAGGRAEGEANKAISIAKNLMKMGVITIKQISEVASLSQEKLRELKATV